MVQIGREAFEKYCNSGSFSASFLPRAIISFPDVNRLSVVWIADENAPMVVTLVNRIHDEISRPKALGVSDGAAAPSR
jgi:hypothetical protein